MVLRFQTAFLKGTGRLKKTFDNNVGIEARINESLKKGYIMFKYAAVFCVLAIAACASISGGKFSGESATFGGNNILRNDVFELIKKWERSAFSCNAIESVHAKIDDLKRVEGRLRVLETWTVNACGKSHDYRINMREDARGETDFGVSYQK